MVPRPFAAAFLLCTVAVVPPARSAHPEVLVNPADHDAVASKLRDAGWARAKYAQLKARVDGYVTASGGDPAWLASRLAMNWQTRAVTPVCEGSRYVRGDGRAAVPTPRFAGARDWATPYAAPAQLADVRPYNDDDRGRLFLHDRTDGTDAWVPPGVTGRAIEGINQRVLQAAADAAFVYWVTGDERYARFGADAVWTYMDGFARVTPPELPPGDTSMAGIVGSTSFEVIHEDVVTPIAVAYDLLHDYLVGQGRDVTVVQAGLKRMVDRVIDGGSREGNWNLNQARIISYGGLALEADDAYPDHRGRPYYVDVVLHADLPHQFGVARVIHHGLDPQSALWPEAAGYGFGSAKDITLIATLVGTDPAGRALLGDPVLPRNVLAQANLTYPNGLAVGLGDTTDTRVNAEQVELMIAAARGRGDAATEGQLTAVLGREIAAGRYDRSAPADDLVALTKFVAELRPAPAAGPPPLVRSFYGRPLNVVVQRLLGTDPDASLAAAMYGTGGGHVHANGLAVELYGAGLTMGADPGRGDSYWTKNHGEYYSQPPAHNTVIVNGRSDYAVTPAGQIHMTVQLAEPAPSDPAAPAAGVCHEVGSAQCGFDYPDATQQRTLALVRPDPAAAGFYFDVFRSRAAGEQFHDYLYHNVGRLESVTTAAGGPVPLVPSAALDPDGKLLKGYTYFTGERSAGAGVDWHARFGVALSGGPPRHMDVWMPAAADRTLFSVDAPPDHEARDPGDQQLSTMPMPTLVLRQRGPAWDRPFVAVYAPSVGDGPAAVDAVTAAPVSAADDGLVACHVHGAGSTTLLLQDDRPDRSHADVGGVRFRGSFAAVITRDGRPPLLYLGSGTALAAGGVGIAADAAVAAAVWSDGSAWRYSASGPVTITLPSAAAVTLPAGHDRPVGP